MEDKCTCGSGENDYHRCPYSDDIHNEYELDDDEVTMCNCCPECTYQCAMDI